MAGYGRLTAAVKYVEPAIPGGRLVQDLTMNDRASMTGSNDDDLGGQPAGPAGPAEPSEAALTQELLRLQERHREGGIEPELVLGGDGGSAGPLA
jgi:hypothetical protein